MKLTKKEIEYLMDDIAVVIDSYIVNRRDLPKKYRDIQDLKVIPEIVWKKADCSPEIDMKFLEKLYKKLEEKDNGKNRN